MAFSPDGKRLVTGGNDETAQIWDASSGKRLAVLEGHTGGVLSAAFSPDGRRIATGSWNGTIRLWDAASAKTIAVLEGHTGVVSSVAFNPDGDRIASTSFDQTVRLWDAASGRPLIVLQGHAGLNSAAFSPDGGRLATAGDDGTVRLWIARESPEDREKRRRFWREQQADGAEKAGRWFAAAFHLDRLIDETPANPVLYARRCRAGVYLGRWQAVMGDFIQALMRWPADAGPGA